MPGDFVFECCDVCAGKRGTRVSQLKSLHHCFISNRLSNGISLLVIETSARNRNWRPCVPGPTELFSDSHTSGLSPSTVRLTSSTAFDTHPFPVGSHSQRDLLRPNCRTRY